MDGEDQVLSDVSRWWAGMPGYEPTGVPETARLPMYSTWYTGTAPDLDTAKLV
jgi:hypothetical protein